MILPSAWVTIEQFRHALLRLIEDRPERLPYQQVPITPALEVDRDIAKLVLDAFDEYERRITDLESNLHEYERRLKEALHEYERRLKAVEGVRDEWGSRARAAERRLVELGEKLVVDIK